MEILPELLTQERFPNSQLPFFGVNGPDEVPFNLEMILKHDEAPTLYDR
jgi:hypothetical protein